MERSAIRICTQAPGARSWPWRARLRRGADVDAGRRPRARPRPRRSSSRPCSRSSRHIFQQTQSSRRPPASSRPTTLSSWVVISAKPIRMTTAAARPSRMAFCAAPAAGRRRPGRRRRRCRRPAPGRSSAPGRRRRRRRRSRRSGDAIAPSMRQRREPAASSARSAARARRLHRARRRRRRRRSGSRSRPAWGSGQHVAVLGDQPAQAFALGAQHQHGRARRPAPRPGSARPSPARPTARQPSVGQRLQRAREIDHPGVRAAASTAPAAALASAPVSGGAWRSCRITPRGAEGRGRAEDGADVLRVGDLVEHQQHRAGPGVEVGEVGGLERRGLAAPRPGARRPAAGAGRSAGCRRSRSASAGGRTCASICLARSGVASSSCGGAARAGWPAPPPPRASPRSSRRPPASGAPSGTAGGLRPRRFAASSGVVAFGMTRPL